MKLKAPKECQKSPRRLGQCSLGTFVFNKILLNFKNYGRKKKQVEFIRNDPDGIYLHFLIPGFYSKKHPYDITIDSLGKEELKYKNTFNSMWHWIYHLREKRWWDGSLEYDFKKLVNNKLPLWERRKK